jgi:hypothetical protein
LIGCHRENNHCFYDHIFFGDVYILIVFFFFLFWQVSTQVRIHYPTVQHQLTLNPSRSSQKFVECSLIDEENSAYRYCWFVMKAEAEFDAEEQLKTLTAPIPTVEASLVV